jgi:hypothetical protein
LLDILVHRGGTDIFVSAHLTAALYQGMTLVVPQLRLNRFGYRLPENSTSKDFEGAQL